MERPIFFAATLGLILFSANIYGQAPRSPLDNYLETGKTIVIAECLAVGPVNILLQADVKVRILYVLKGNETLREITVRSQYGMERGKRYLLRTEVEASSDRRYFDIDSRDSVVELVPSEKIEFLKTLPLRIVVLRTMNMRVDVLEAEMRSLTHELDSLKEARREN